MVEGIVYRYRTGIARQDLPRTFGPWQTVWAWHRRLAADGTWDVVLDRLVSAADATGAVDWSVSVDSTIARAHQHATNITRVTGGSCPCWPHSASPGRSDGHVEQGRGLATRYDTLATVYRAAIILNAVIAWLRHLQDSP
jgi:putative transposase